MDNRSLDNFLHAKFEVLETLDPNPQTSLVPQVMAQIEHLSPVSRERSWVIGFALLVGSLFCLPSLQVIHAQVSLVTTWVTAQAEHWVFTAGADQSALYLVAGLLLLLPLALLLED